MTENVVELNADERMFVNVDECGRIPVRTMFDDDNQEAPCYRFRTYSDGSIRLTPIVPRGK